MTAQDIFELDRAHTIYSWKAQKHVKPIIIDHADGVTLTDVKRQGLH
jgi:hypothetical protein